MAVDHKGVEFTGNRHIWIDAQLYISAQIEIGLPSLNTCCSMIWNRYWLRGVNWYLPWMWPWRHRSGYTRGAQKIPYILKQWWSTPVTESLSESISYFAIIILLSDDKPVADYWLTMWVNNRPISLNFLRLVNWRTSMRQFTSLRKFRLVFWNASLVL